MAYATATLTGKYQHFDGTPAAGVVEIIPSERVVKDTTGDVILSGRVKLTLDDTGSFTVDLPATDDTTLNPTGFGYTLAAKLRHQHLAAVSFQLPGGTVVDIEDVTSVDPSTFEPTATYVEAATVDALDDRVTTLETTPAVTSYLDLTDTPTIPATAEDVGADPAGTAAAAVAAITPADIGAVDDGTFQAVAEDVNDHETALTGRLAESELKATFASVKGANLGRFIKRAQAGEALTITALGDSVLHGQTVTDPATDGVMLLLEADLESRFGNSVTLQNRAVGGRTLLSAHTFGDVASALADQADLYVIGYGKNDSLIYFGTQGGEYGPGYPRAQSWAALERVVRRIRDRSPKADIVLLAENAYDQGSTTANVALAAYNEGVQRIAAANGCEYVDCFTPFVDLGTDQAAYMADGTHPNTLGHRLMADTLLEHFPENYRGAAVAPGRPGLSAVYNAGTVDATKGSGGYVFTTAAAATGVLTFTKTGAGWAGTAPHATSGVGDYAEFKFTGTELHLNMSTREVDSPVFDVSVDGVTVKSGADPTLAAAEGDYYVPVALGLTAAAHTVRITLVSGTLKINSANALIGPGSDLIPNVVTVDITGSIPAGTVNSTGSKHDLVSYGLVPLPAGWNAMLVQLSGYAFYRVTGQTTTQRTVQTILRRMTAPTAIAQNVRVTFGPVDTGVLAYNTIPVTEVVATASTALEFNLEAYVTSTDKTNVVAESWNLKAVCHRLA